MKIKYLGLVKRDCKDDRDADESYEFDIEEAFQGLLDTERAVEE